MTCAMSDYKEELFEEGYVESISQGIATIIIKASGSCEECSAKIYCNPQDAVDRKLQVKESLGIVTGDKVRISIKGRNLFLASLLLYGIPLVILIVTLITGMNIFKDNPELYSFFSTIILLAGYYILLWLYSRKWNENKNILPEIVRVFKDNHP